MIFLKKYFDQDFPDGFLSLYGSRTLMMISSGFLGLFIPIFLFNLLNLDIKLVVLYYGFSSLIYIFLVPLGALFLNKFSFRNSLRLSIFWAVLFYIIFYFLDFRNAGILIPLSIVTLVIWRTFFWLPYHVDFTKFTDSEDRARQISIFNITSSITGGLIPILSGFLIAKFGYDYIFVIAMILALLSGLFFIKIPKVNERFEWTYKQTWSEFISKKNRASVWAFMADGIEGMVGLVIWPIFIFQLLDGNYFQVGYISALVVVVTIVLQFFLGKSLDRDDNKKTVLRYGTFLYSLGWIGKIFIVTAFHIFVIGIYHNLTKIFARTSFDVLTYDTAADQGHFVDEFTVIHEMAIHSGKIFAVVFIIVLSLYFPLQWTFLIAAASSILMNIVTDINRYGTSRVEHLLK